MKITMKSLNEVIPYAGNAKKHDKKQIANVAESIRQYGFVQPVVVDRNGVIVIGHCRVLAAKKLGLEEVPCVCVDDLTPEQVDALRLVDNKSNESDWDFDMLADLVPQLDLSMFDFDWGLPEMSKEEVREDEAPEVDEESEPVTKLGDIWKLGRHRLMCGDSTSAECVQKLMGGAQADILLTDPPYNVNYGSVRDVSEAVKRHRRTDGLMIKNDNMDDDAFRKFLTGAFACANEVLKPGAVFYIWHADNEGYNFRGACRDVGRKVRECLIWNKNTFCMGRQDYQWKHEPCLYGWKDGASHLWASDRKQTTVMNFDKPSKSELHPTMKPVALFDYQIKNNTKGGDIVLDLFGGSGTTVAACEQNGRNAYVMELDPKYCDVIVKRWENLTGEKAVLADD